MYWFLLKKALPFTLTFIFGAALSGLTGLFGASGKKAESVLTTRTYEFGKRCRTRRHRLVAESKPLAILDAPEARYPNAARPSVRVNALFGPDGKVLSVQPLSPLSDAPDGYRVMDREMWEAVESAAYEIRFTPETVNGMPVTVWKEVEIKLVSD
jgi:hypothetical protein